MNDISLIEQNTELFIWEKSEKKQGRNWVIIGENWEMSLKRMKNIVKRKTEQT